ncbi:MAG: FapA family protein [Planctomycetaceae bacterium]
MNLEPQIEDPVKNQPVPSEASEAKAPPSPYFELVVSEDRLKASLCLEGEGKENITLGDIKKFLKEKGILHGVAEDSALEELLKSGAILEGLCLVAQGTPPEPGVDAQVTYHFDKDPLKIGVMKVGGGIDFRDKGEIPQVKEGALLAEKVPLVQEKPGKDVLGQTLDVAPAKDIPLMAGPGTKVSEDRLKIYAQKKGRPTVSNEGSFSVINELIIPGDVGLGTGHIRFDGFVDVGGAVEAGFQVKAGRLTVKEIHRGEVDSESDIVVSGGVIGGKVVCRGNLKTRFIQYSQVEAGGDVIVEGEIIDSKIETRGAVIAKPMGRILASRILAAKGVMAAQIGSASSKPCFLTVGIDAHLQSLIKKIQGEIAAKEGEEKKLKASVEVLNQASYKLKEDVVKWVQVRDQLAGEQRISRKKMEDLKEKNDPAGLAQAQQELEKVEQKVKTAEEHLQKLMAKENLILEKTTPLQSQLKELKVAVESLQGEIKKIHEESHKKGIATVQVSKEIFPGTILEGRHSKLVLQESQYQALIKETLRNEVSPEGNHTTSWGMEFYPLPRE